MWVCIHYRADERAALEDVCASPKIMGLIAASRRGEDWTVGGNQAQASVSGIQQQDCGRSGVFPLTRLIVRRYQPTCVDKLRDRGRCARRMSPAMTWPSSCAPAAASTPMVMGMALSKYSTVSKFSRPGGTAPELTLSGELNHASVSGGRRVTYQAAPPLPNRISHYQELRQPELQVPVGFVDCLVGRHDGL